MWMDVLLLLAAVLPLMAERQSGGRKPEAVALELPGDVSIPLPVQIEAAPASLLRRSPEL
jgi:hypothetical protein